MAEGYSEAEYSSSIEIGGMATGIVFNLTTKVTLQTPKMCRLPQLGRECNDSTNGIKVTVPPSASVAIPQER